MTILVVLESPAKVKKVSGFLGNDYIVKSSYGHIRDLHKKELSIEVNNNFKPIYHSNDDKEFVISDLKRNYKKCDGILLASDFDREGESIAWHISEILKIPIQNRKRLLFTEITKKALLKAVEEPKDLDLNMFYSQQARRIIDRLIGYMITPLLWKNIQSSMKKGISLSAGRVQSVVNKLILEREDEIESFKSKNYFKTDSTFIFNKKNLNFNLEEKIATKEEAEELLENCANYDFKVDTIKKTNSKRTPSSPFITSSLQQEASNKFKFSPKKTMQVAQKLYENGYITYMRTDSVILCDDIMKSIEDYVKDKYGNKYYNKTVYKNKSKNSQEAHEAIRPSNILVNNLEDEKDANFDSSHIKLYNLIWRRTVASQMSQAKVENQSIISKIKTDTNKTYTFTCKNQKVVFDGFLKVYKPFNDNENDSDNEQDDSDLTTLDIKEGDSLVNDEINSVEKFTKPPQGRFSEASLVKKLEELGIGRPSTYSSMVSTIQDRNYVVRKDIEGVEKDYVTLRLKDYTIEENTDKVKTNSEKQKLVPTEIGKIVNNYLDLHFEKIINYQFTNNLEKELDGIANGTKDWVSVVKGIYNVFNPIIENLGSSNMLEKDKFKRIIGVDPKTDFEVVTYIAKYGPCVQLKNTNDLSKSKFAPLGDLKMESITLEQALELLKYPYIFCQVNKKDVIVNRGKYGVYLKYNSMNISLGEIEEKDLTKKIIKDLINRKLNPSVEYTNNEATTNTNQSVKISETISVKNGKYGYYINQDKNNVSLKYSKIFKQLKKKPEDLNEEECKNIIKEYIDYKKSKKK